MSVRKIYTWTCQYIYIQQQLALDESILDQRGSYTDEWQSLIT